VALVLKKQPAQVVQEFDKLWTAAKDWVQEAELLWQEGKLSGVDENREKFNFVFDKLKAQFPNLEEQTLIQTLEAAVKWLKMLMN
jgi:hypothetical protein